MKVVFIPSDIYSNNYPKLIVFNELSCIYNNLIEGKNKSWNFNFSKKLSFARG